MIEWWMNETTMNTFCSVNCVDIFRTNRSNDNGQRPQFSTTAAGGPMPVIQSVSSLAGAGEPPAQPDRLPTQPLPAAQLGSSPPAVQQVAAQGWMLFQKFPHFKIDFLSSRLFNSRIVSAMSSPRSGPDDPRDGEGHDGAHPRASGGAEQGDAHEAVHADQGYLVQASHYDQVRREAFKSTSIIKVGRAVDRF